jgi:hypothetical protein
MNGWKRAFLDKGDVRVRDAGQREPVDSGTSDAPATQERKLPAAPGAGPAVLACPTPVLCAGCGGLGRERVLVAGGAFNCWPPAASSPRYEYSWRACSVCRGVGWVLPVPGGPPMPAPVPQYQPRFPGLGLGAPLQHQIRR